MNVESLLRKVSRWLFGIAAVLLFALGALSDDAWGAVGYYAAMLLFAYVVYMFLFELVAAIVRLIRRSSKQEEPKP